MAEYPGKLRLSVRHVAFHRGADYAVKVLEAARKQGKYWEVLDVLFAKQSIWTVGHKADPERLMDVIKGVGLDLPRLQQDMEAPDVAKLMQQDMADAKTLKVAADPGLLRERQALEAVRRERIARARRERGEGGVSVEAPRER